MLGKNAKTYSPALVQSAKKSPKKHIQVVITRSWFHPYNWPKKNGGNLGFFTDFRTGRNWTHPGNLREFSFEGGMPFSSSWDQFKVDVSPSLPFLVGGFLKKMRTSNCIISPKFRDEYKKSLSWHHLVSNINRHFPLNHDFPSKLNSIFINWVAIQGLSTSPNHLKRLSKLPAKKYWKVSHETKTRTWHEPSNPDCLRTGSLWWFKTIIF